MTKPYNTDQAHADEANKMWGGRFEAAPAELMTQINASIDVDKRLYQQDILGSIVHAEMLGRQGIIPPEDAETIIGGLKRIWAEIENGELKFSAMLEDIHMNVEARLKELIGDTAGRLHTARSRNDQVATDFRLWLRDAIDALVDDIQSLQTVLRQRATEHAETIMPGFTHLQVAQPITLALHLDAYVQMLERDRQRFEQCRQRMNECPLGAGALAGTSYPIDRQYTAEKLGFSRPMPNTLDAVSARDFVLEFLSVASICAIHLSRFAEELVIWSTPQFGFVRMSDAYSTGSSIMPQKKNPDAAELVRAKAGFISARLVQLLMVLKALPLAYNKDLQDDKEPVFDVFDTLRLCLNVMAGMVSEMTVQEDAMRTQAESGYATATDLADWLVQNLGMPFRDAHHVTGRIVKLAEARKCGLDQLELAEMQEIEPKITSEIFNALRVERAVKERGL